MIRVEDLKENILGLTPGNKYSIYSRSRKGRGSYLSEGILIGESGVNNEFYVFQSKHGYKECYLKIDLIIGDYLIRETLENRKGEKIG